MDRWIEVIILLDVTETHQMHAIKQDWTERHYLGEYLDRAPGREGISLSPLLCTKKQPQQSPTTI